MKKVLWPSYVPLSLYNYFIIWLSMHTFTHTQTWLHIALRALHNACASQWHLACYTNTFIIVFVPYGSVWVTNTEHKFSNWNGYMLCTNKHANKKQLYNFSSQTYTTLFTRINLTKFNVKIKFMHSQSCGSSHHEVMTQMAVKERHRITRARLVVLGRPLLTTGGCYSRVECTANWQRIRVLTDKIMCKTMHSDLGNWKHFEKLVFWLIVWTSKTWYSCIAISETQNTALKPTCRVVKKKKK
jgi:hypothetical protein